MTVLNLSSHAFRSFVEPNVANRMILLERNYVITFTSAWNSNVYIRIRPVPHANKPDVLFASFICAGLPRKSFISDAGFVGSQTRFVRMPDFLSICGQNSGCQVAARKFRLPAFETVRRFPRPADRSSRCAPADLPSVPGDRGACLAAGGADPVAGPGVPSLVHPSSPAHLGDKKFRKKERGLGGIPGSAGGARQPGCGIQPGLRRIGVSGVRS